MERTYCSREIVLVVPKLTRNLLSVSQLKKQYPFNCEFSNDFFFCVKERVISRILLIGKRRGDLYFLPSPKEANFSHRQQHGSKDLWH